MSCSAGNVRHSFNTKRQASTPYCTRGICNAINPRWLRERCVYRHADGRWCGFPAKSKIHTRALYTHLFEPIDDGKRQCYLCGSKRTQLVSVCAHPTNRYGYQCFDRTACTERKRKRGV